MHCCWTLRAISASQTGSAAACARYNDDRRYLVRAKLKSGCSQSLLEAITDGTLGAGSVAEVEYINDASFFPGRDCALGGGLLLPHAVARESPYSEEYFEPVKSTGCS